MKDKPAKKIFGKSKSWKPLSLPQEPVQPKLLQKPVSAKGHLVPRKRFEPIISRPIELDCSAAEAVFRLHGVDGEGEIRSCYGDIYKVINALMDYARLLELACDEWDLQGYYRVSYELHAEKLRAIAKKYQESIGYDYDAALARCEAKKKRQHKDNDIGGDGLEMAVKRGQLNSKKSQAGKKEN